jgi:lysyl oxidase-like protein 2/3/4
LQYSNHGKGGADEIKESVINKFLDVDTFGAYKILSRPYDANIVSQIPLKYLEMTAKDRSTSSPTFRKSTKVS